jgi:hypothetical protein
MPMDNSYCFFGQGQAIAVNAITWGKMQQVNYWIKLCRP